MQKNPCLRQLKEAQTRCEEIPGEKFCTVEPNIIGPQYGTYFKPIFVAQNFEVNRNFGTACGTFAYVCGGFMVHV
jgi:hypothetical protein